VLSSLLKVNFALVYVFRDNHGHLIQVHSLIFSFVTTVAECEATTLQHAFQIALDCGLSQVVFESDC
jgi:hypothetical protein